MRGQPMSLIPSRRMMLAMPGCANMRTTTLSVGKQMVDVQGKSQFFTSQMRL